MSRAPHVTRLVALAALVGGAAACSDYLKVTNPGASPIDRVGDPANAPLLVNGAIAQFQNAVDTVAIFGAVLSDEITAAHSNNSYRDLDRRDFAENTDLVSLTYSPLQRTRFAADTTALILAAQAGDSAPSDPRIARMLALGGYARVFLGETFCTAPIALSAPYTPEQLNQQAVAKFDSAIAIATAAKAANRQTAASDSILNFALVGAARASLNINDKAKAAQYAALVPAAFEYRVYNSEGIPVPSGLPINPFWNGTGAAGTPGLGASLAPATPGSTRRDTVNFSNGTFFSTAAVWTILGETFFRNPNVTDTTSTDRRMPIGQRLVNTMSTAPQGLTRGFVPFKPASFGGWTGTYTPITPGASIRVASGLEAQYIAAEASGAPTVAFLNAQRTRGGLRAYAGPTTAAALLADLREQKRREFYLDGHRLGEIRRYKAQYSLDFFPQGTYVGSNIQYGTRECMPLPPSELNANPNANNG